MLKSLILGLLVSAGLHDGATLQGTVRAEGTHEPVSQARVQIAELGRSVATDAQGYFVIADIPAGRWNVEASALGYGTVELVIVSSGTGAVRLDLLLPRQPVRLGELPVHIESTRAGGMPTTEAGPGPARLAGPGQLKYIPGLAEPDVLRALQQLPSVAAISDFSSALYVRGGSADQNLITLDGVPLFNPYHLGGLFSAINADAVAGVDVWAGALPAREGDRISSAVRIDTRDGGRDHVRASGAIGLISSNVTVDGPMGSRGSYLVSGRRTYVDAASRVLYATGVTNATMPYGFSDLLLKATHDVGELGRLSVTGYLNREGVSMPDRMRAEMNGNAELGWGSRVAAIAFRRPIGAQLMWNSRVAFTDFTGDFDVWNWSTSSFCDATECLDFGPADTTHEVTAATHARDIIAESELAWYGRTNTLRGGVRHDGYTFAHRLSARQDDDMLPSFAAEESRTTIAAFIEDEWRATDRIDVRAGVRMLHAGELGTAWLPRVGARVRLGSSWSLTAGAGRYAQAIRSMRTDESAVSSLIAYDVLTTQPLEAGLVRGSDVVAGIQFARGSTSVSLDAYAKQMDGLVLPRDLSDPVHVSPLVIDTFDVGSGTARGIELLARHDFGRLELSGSYTYSTATRTAAGETYTPRFDRRHVVDVTALLPWGESGILSARLGVGTGQPFTKIVGQYTAYHFDPVTGEFVHRGVGLLLDEHNGARLPGYFRLDVAARRAFDKHWFGRDMKVTPYVQILNVLNTRNVLLSEPQTYQQPRYTYWPQLPIFPTFGVEWHF